MTRNWIVIEGWRSERGHWTDNGCSVLGLMACSFTAFYCLVTQRQQMCLHNLYYPSLTSCQHVCVETIEGLPQRHMCSGYLQAKNLNILGDNLVCSLTYCYSKVAILKCWYQFHVCAGGREVQGIFGLAFAWHKDWKQSGERLKSEKFGFEKLSSK